MRLAGKSLISESTDSCQPAGILSADKLQKELEEKSESDRKTMEDEIQELKALLPDLESKVRAECESSLI